MNYNIKNITNLLSNAFNDTDLTTFCQSYFWEVFNNFSAGQSKAQKISALIDFCQRNMQIDRLLELMKEENPAQYERFLPYEIGDYKAKKKEVETNKISNLKNIYYQKYGINIITLQDAVRELQIVENEIKNITNKI